MRIAGLLLLAGLIPLTGCSYTTWLTGADENGGTVNGVNQLSTDSAVEKANEHCHKYNKVARVIRTDQASSTLTFSCQGPD
ncbi:MAG TPA: hypothetical protein VHY57_01780 [Rhizomicrobium sp.]|jgi:hypothetical protein|nr:hypothetical protein [Rhizomicrobium sp.]